MTRKEKITLLEKQIKGHKPRGIDAFVWKKYVERTEKEIARLKESRPEEPDPYASAKNIGKTAKVNKSFGSKKRPDRPSNGWCANQPSSFELDARVRDGTTKQLGDDYIFSRRKRMENI